MSGIHSHERTCPPIVEFQPPRNAAVRPRLRFLAGEEAAPTSEPSTGDEIAPSRALIGRLCPRLRCLTAAAVASRIAAVRPDIPREAAGEIHPTFGAGPIPAAAREEPEPGTAMHRVRGMAVLVGPDAAW